MDGSRVVRRSLAAVLATSSVLAALLAGATPASASEVGRKHPSGRDPGGDPATDSHVTLVKYYDIFNGVGKYEFCLEDAHSPISSVTGWTASADYIHWSNGSDQAIPRQRGLWCSGFKALHGTEFVSYHFGSIGYSASL